MQLPKFLQVAQEIMRNAESSEKYANELYIAMHELVMLLVMQERTAICTV